MTTRPDPASGFVLISVILAMSLLCLLGGLLQLELALTAALVTESETQLQSQVLAENGIELARAVVAGVDVDLQELLAGSDGVFDCASAPGRRDPIPLETARQADLSLTTASCDDGLPWMLGVSSARPALGSGEQGWTLLRFTNDSDEPPNEEHNDTVVVRAMGVVPSKLRRTAHFAGINNVTVLEACLRRERAFAVDTALTLIGQKASLELAAPDCISADGDPPVEVVEFPESGLSADIEQSAANLGLAGAQWYRNVTEVRSADPAFRRLLDPDFWREFEERWARLAGEWAGPEEGGGLHVVEDGAVFDGRLSGLFLTRGEVVLGAGTDLTGLIVHLGGGGVRIESGATVSGALWISGIAFEAQELKPEMIHLEVGSGAHLVYDAEIVRRAMAYLPPTVFRWRIIFPEMAD